LCSIHRVSPPEAGNSSKKLSLWNKFLYFIEEQIPDNLRIVLLLIRNLVLGAAFILLISEVLKALDWFDYSVEAVQRMSLIYVIATLSHFVIQMVLAIFFHATEKKLKTSVAKSKVLLLIPTYDEDLNILKESVMSAVKSASRVNGRVIVINNSKVKPDYWKSFVHRCKMYDKTKRLFAIHSDEQ